MSAFTTVMTTVTSMNDSIVLLFDKGVILTYTPELVVDQLANIQTQINAKSIQFSIYTNMTAATSALTESDDLASVALADNSVVITPAEQGNVVTRTRLASFQTGGKVDIAAAQLVGRNMGVSVDKIAMTALEAFTTTVIYPNSATAVTNLSISDNLDLKFANRLYNKLARLNVPGLTNGNYFGVAHDDCLFDLREAMIPVRQYQDLTGVLANEVGMAAGIRWLRSSNVTVTADSNGTIDSYKVNVVGLNALGKAVAEAPHPVISGPFDKLGRFLNVGWYGVFAYSCVDTNNQVQGICASSVGAN